VGQDFPDGARRLSAHEGADLAQHLAGGRLLAEDQPGDANGDQQ
jgi:hypothetical protein